MENKPLILLKYEYIKEPINIVQYLNTDELFIDWLEDGGVSDLEATLKEFESAELYHHCALIKNVLDIKKSIAD